MRNINQEWLSDWIFGILCDALEGEPVQSLVVSWLIIKNSQNMNTLEDASAMRRWGQTQFFVVLQRRGSSPAPA